MRERNAGVRGDGDGSTDAGDHLEGDRRRCESLGFLAAPSKDEGIAATLVSCGRAPSTPVALIRWGTTEAQETMTCALGDLADPQAALDLRPPLVTVIGDVVSLRDQLRWFDVPPALEAAMATVSFAKTASDSLGERPCSCDRPRRARLVGGRAVQAIGRGTERRGSQWGSEGQSEGRRGAGGARWWR